MEVLPGMEPLPEPELAPEPPPAAQPKYQRVWIWQETNDSLWKMAKDHYGDPFLWPKIYEANRAQIKDPAKIYPKQQILIPPLDEAPAPAARPARRQQAPEPAPAVEPEPVFQPAPALEPEPAPEPEPAAEPEPAFEPTLEAPAEQPIDVPAEPPPDWQPPDWLINPEGESAPQ